MDSKRIDRLEANILALRKIADLLLVEVQAEKSAAPARRRRNSTLEEDAANLRMRLMCGIRKPETAKTRKKKRA
ncbi:hypothetical protein ACQKLP_23725 [Chitinophaga sp. NPDC101104]|uniref:hypothetical protein n=1 Tax=Chitinophaga sp. NPDC101104 TaxID=3390561 RepID=UPI003D057E5D